MVPTAEEFLKQVSPNDEFGLRIDLGNSKKHIYEIMCRFAKLHVEQALKEASKKVTCREETQYDEFDNAILIAKINRDSILNAYPPENIK